MGANISFNELDLFKNDYTLLSDFIDFFCGKCIGEGESRSVYEFRLDNTLVIKIDRIDDLKGRRGFNNVSEYELYNNVKDDYPKIAQFMAPCISISKCGKVMLQKKTRPLTDKEKKLLPKKIPALFTDIKLENWGMLSGKFVCHDYANNTCFTLAANTNFKKAEWLERGLSVVK